MYWMHKIYLYGLLVHPVVAIVPDIETKSHRYRCDGVVVRAAASQSVDLGFIS